MALKSFLNKMGLVEDDIPVTAKPKTAQATPVSNPAPSTYTSMTSFSTPAVDPSIEEMLNQSLQENKLSGFDYLKFISAVDEAKSTGVPEDSRFKMIFSTAKQLGVDKNTLLKSGSHYVDVLAQDESDFNADCDQYEKKEIQYRQDRLTSIENEIAKMTKELAQLNQDRATLTQELVQEKSKLESRKVAFSVTLESIRTKIKSNIDKINQYL